MEYGFKTAHQNSESSYVSRNIDVTALCPDKDMEETVIIRVFCLPVDSVQVVSADEG